MPIHVLEIISIFYAYIHSGNKHQLPRLHALWNKTWDPERKASTWLDETVAAYQEMSRVRKEVRYFSSVVKNETVQLTIDMAKDDQMAVALLVF